MAIPAVTDDSGGDPDDPEDVSDMPYSDQLSGLISATKDRHDQKVAGAPASPWIFVNNFVNITKK